MHYCLLIIQLLDSILIVHNLFCLQSEVNNEIIQPQSHSPQVELESSSDPAEVILSLDYSSA